MTVALPAADTSIRVEAITKRYAGRPVVDGVSFQIGAGEICALLGPNGAGKTTTAEIVEGYRRPDDGSVRVLGVDPAHGGPQFRARVGLMLQQGGIDPRMRPLETLRLHARFFRRPRDPARLLEQVGLGTVASTPYRRLSGGERQRLSLALAIVGEPEVLVLDEPTAGMDPEARASTRELVAGMRDAGAAILLTTHELADVERLADRIVVIAGGRVAAVGTPTELMAGGGAHLRFRLTSELTEADVDSLASQLGGPLLVQGEGRYRLEAPAADPVTIAALATWCAERGLTIVDLRSGGLTLEERYLELVRGATDG